LFGIEMEEEEDFGSAPHFTILNLFKVSVSSRCRFHQHFMHTFFVRKHVLAPKFHMKALCAAFCNFWCQNFVRKTRT
jgi:hypothetical protein